MKMECLEVIGEGLVHETQTYCLGAMEEKALMTCGLACYPFSSGAHREILFCSSALDCTRLLKEVLFYILFGENICQGALSGIV